MPGMQPSPTAPIVRVRDTDTLLTTAITVVSGSTIGVDSLPAHWTLEFDFGQAVTVAFRFDGGLIQLSHAPYCPNGHDHPLNLGVGPHTIDVLVNGALIEPLTFVLEKMVETVGTVDTVEATTPPGRTTGDEGVDVTAASAAPVPPAPQENVVDLLSL